MARLIDAEKLWLTTEYTEDGKVHKYYEQFEVDEAPTIDAEPVRHGKWDDTRVAFYRKCSECGATVKNNLPDVFLDCDIRDLHYCPNCGAKMDSNDSNDSNALNALEMDEVNDEVN